MKNVYLDQMIYSYLTQDNNKFGFSIEDLPEKLGNYNLLISTENMYELAQLNEVDRVIKSLEKCNILFLPLAYQIQNEQLIEYIYKKYYNYQYKPLIICEYISQLFTYIERTPTNIPIGSSLNELICIFSKKELIAIRKQSELAWCKNAKEIYNDIQQAPEKETNDRGLNNRLKKLLIEMKDPFGKSICSSIHEKIINDLLDLIQKNPETMPAIHIENLFFEFRYNKNSRKPVRNDPRDIGHIICGLSTSDYFVTCDRYMLRFCENVKSKYIKIPDCRDNLDFLSK